MGLPIVNPTYFLAPNWTFRPDGPIALGNIIANPLKPHIVLTTPDPTRPLPATTTVSESDWKLVDESGRALSLSLWANFLESIQLKFGALHGKKLRTEYSIDKLETTYFRDGVTSELVMERVKDPVIKELMKPESILSKPVFMITGIKIARGFRLSSENDSKHGGRLGAGVPAAVPVSVGGEGTFDVDKAQNYSFNSDAVVFAYQLLKIAPKGWAGRRGVHGTEYQSAGAFLGDEGGDDGDVELEVEFSYFQTADLNDLGLNPDEAVNEKKGSGVDGEEEYSAISSKVE
ncbi:hypothetical protein MMYC01_200420 [Madurella mycetomatis]|uniref:Uncharacterized protein n=1 Tax=Madurella mycetomatis TaxID=100816 RepID=A0A175WH94_9PEZI|nr:hypothetical protein MMYC01_201770 [Madurella mycetomatis]KXX82990.1 hypothetical protein MMYC01_200420 [Madurella mycetomatis]